MKLEDCMFTPEEKISFSNLDRYRLAEKASYKTALKIIEWLEQIDKDIADKLKGELGL